MKNLLLFIAINVSAVCLCQTKGQLLFSLDVGNQKMGMNEINSIILDNELFILGQLNTTRENRFTDGNKLVGSLGYQFTPYWELGGCLNYQYADCHHFDGFLIYDDWLVLDTILRERNYFSSSLTGGIYSRLNVSKILALESHSPLLNRLLLGVNFSVGYSKSQFVATDYFLSIENDKDRIYERELYRSSARGLHLETSFDIGIKLSKGKLFSSLGAEIGYQYLVTGHLANRSGDSIMELERTSNIDMSGIFINAFIKIGR